MKTYIMQSATGAPSTFTGNPSEVVDQMTKNTQMAFKTREDFRRSYAQFACDWSNKPVRFTTDEELVEDLVSSGLLKEQK